MGQGMKSLQTGSFLTPCRQDTRKLVIALLCVVDGFLRFFTCRSAHEFFGCFRSLIASRLSTA